MSGPFRIARGVVREAGPVAGLLVIALLDYVTGPLVAVSPFYLAVLVAVALRRAVPAALAYGAFAAALVLTVDLITVPALAGTPYPYWRGIAQLLSFSAVTFTIPRLRAERHRLLRSEETLVRQRTALEDLNAKLVSALEELGAARQLTVETVLARHPAAFDDLTRRRGRVLNGTRAASTPDPLTGGTDAPETL